MSLVKFRRDPAMSPWAEMADMQNRIRHLFAEPFPSLRVFAEPVGWTPAVDVSESDGTLVVKAELPGMAKDDVEIDLVDNVLTLRGEKKLEEERTEGEMHVWERSYGSFQRAFTLPCRVQEDRVTAEVKNGVLTITLPKAEEARGRKIEVAG
ncbi:MAG TPA: Hsp20/alpha crystallin family protein [Longimicrobium sp.]|nr:Hsp20/alpha crystallin family protein [Longimicrobium sp.]